MRSVIGWLWLRSVLFRWLVIEAAMRTPDRVSTWIADATPLRTELEALLRATPPSAERCSLAGRDATRR
jgi:cell division FtsZ-interacting protein ZapD